MPTVEILFRGEKHTIPEVELKWFIEEKGAKLIKIENESTTTTTVKTKSKK